MLKLKKKRSILSPNLINLSSAKALKGNSKGQTLIEVLIALALLSVMYSIHGQAMVRRVLEQTKVV